MSFKGYPPLLSNSSLKLLIDCPKCFWRDKILKIKRPKGIIPGLQQGMDDIIKVYWDSLRKRGIKIHDENPTIYLFEDQVKLDEWRFWKSGLPRYSHKNIEVMGAVDEVGYEKIKKQKYFLPIDYKTKKDQVQAGYGDKWYKFQLSLYSYLMKQAGMKVTDYGMIAYYSPARQQTKTIFHFNEDFEFVKVDYYAIESAIESAIGVLKGKEPQGNPQCEYCQYIDKIIWDKTSRRK